MKTKLSVALGIFLLSSAAYAGSGTSGDGTEFKVVPMVSDQAGVAPNTDPNLVNPWGLSQAPGNPLWVSDNGTSLSTLYDPTTGAPQSLVVAIPSDGPTGTVFVPPGTGFPITENGATDDSIFLFATESGAILGWSPNVDQTNAVIGVDNSAGGAAYKGLAYDPTDILLFAADFSNNAVEEYDANWHLVRSFTDMNLPSRFAPFNVAWLNNKLYVSFAKRKKTGIDEVDGKGLGFVDVFDTQGNMVSRLVSQGKLDAPWGMTIAPTGFGNLAGALLVGNFGNGQIHAYDANSGKFMGTLRGDEDKAIKGTSRSDGDGNAIVIDGLWSLFPGPDNKTIFFSAGPDGEAHGLLGQIAHKD